ncbi:hypothetical protein RDV84_21195 [Lysobacter yananisis]|uniref:Uncharacterized protein n=1 Tax=Lysobacter yananisis TaxID=1003114 RepID=A0ABY9P612_9GAMM|nr:hypothetical protein [Lysobacter yananisis]WMT02451.1 hypothetical protein RDV84_21195 [Lysobacter yananisis]
MKTFPCLALAAALVLASAPALAEVGNLTNTGYGPTKADAEAKAKKNLEEACTSRNGKIVQGSFKVTFDKPLSNGQHYVDATMQCDIP